MSGRYPCVGCFDCLFIAMTKSVHQSFGDRRAGSCHYCTFTVSTAARSRASVNPYGMTDMGMVSSSYVAAGDDPKNMFCAGPVCTRSSR